MNMCGEKTLDSGTTLQIYTWRETGSISERPLWSVPVAVSRVFADLPSIFNITRQHGKSNCLDLICERDGERGWLNHHLTEAVTCLIGTALCRAWIQGRKRQFKIIWMPWAALWLNLPLQKRPIIPSMYMPLYGLLCASDTIALGPLYRWGVWVTLFLSHGRGKQVRARQNLPTWSRRRNWAQTISWLSATRHSLACNLCQVTVWITVGLYCCSVWVLLPKEGHGLALAGTCSRRFPLKARQMHF